MKRTLQITILLLVLITPLFAQTSPSIELIGHSLVDSTYLMGKLEILDMNKDGIDDFIVNEYYKDGDYGPIIENNIKVIIGKDQGFQSDTSITIVSDPHIFEIFITDWNGDDNPDLITQMSRELEDGGFTNDLMKIWLMNGTQIIDTLEFNVPYQIYLGEQSNPKELQYIQDMDLDGKQDLILIGFSHVTIGWNKDGGVPEFDEITNYGFNTYMTRILDYNQDGYPDFVNDDQYWKEPVIHVNQKNGTFKRTSLGFEEWDFSNPSNLYHSFETLWYNDDIYPDVLAEKSGEEALGGIYQLFQFDANSEEFLKIEFPLPSSGLGKLIPFHFNNDGYIDFGELTRNKFKIWMSNSDTSFTTTEIDTETGFGLKNIFTYDIDYDNDLDVLFSFPESDILYQIVNNETITNEPPSKTEGLGVSINENTANLYWDKSTDTESFSDHLDYFVSLNSDNLNLGFEIHSNNVSINLPVHGDYSLQIVAKDPLGGRSDISDTFIFNSSLVSKESEISSPKIALHQNYPNPFNPNTVIRYQLPVSSTVSLKVFDLLGREVAVLVDGKVTAGTHEVTFNASGLSSGVYFYQLQTNDFLDTKQFTLIK